MMGRNILSLTILTIALTLMMGINPSDGSSENDEGDSIVPIKIIRKVPKVERNCVQLTMEVCTPINPLDKPTTRIIEIENTSSEEEDSSEEHENPADKYKGLKGQAVSDGHPASYSFSTPSDENSEEPFHLTFIHPFPMPMRSAFGGRSQPDGFQSPFTQWLFLPRGPGPESDESSEEDEEESPSTPESKGLEVIKACAGCSNRKDGEEQEPLLSDESKEFFLRFLAAGSDEDYIEIKNEEVMKKVMSLLPRLGGGPNDMIDQESDESKSNEDSAAAASSSSSTEDDEPLPLPLMDEIPTGTPAGQTGTEPSQMSGVEENAPPTLSDPEKVASDDGAILSDENSSPAPSSVPQVQDEVIETQIEPPPVVHEIEPAPATPPAFKSLFIARHNKDA